MLFYLTFAAQCVRHFISTVQSGKLMDGTRATRKNRKKREKWITSKAHPHFPVISARKIAYLLNFYPEFLFFFSVK